MVKITKKRIEGYTRKDRGKIIHVPSHLREIREKGIRSAPGKTILRKQNYIPRSDPPGVTKLKKPITIKVKPRRVIKTGEFADKED